MKVPYYLMTASVPAGNRILRFHGSGEDSAQFLLTRIPRFRWASFDLSMVSPPAPGPEDSIEVRSGERKLLRLFQDGTMLFRARADHDFLGWGIEPQAFERFPRLNPLAVVEVHASFMHAYRLVLQQLKTTPDTIFIKLVLRDSAWDEKRLFLTQYFETSMIDWATVRRYPVQMDPAKDEIEIPALELLQTPNRAGFRALAAFASFFDMPPEDIPFSRETDLGREIDVDRIKALR